MARTSLILKLFSTKHRGETQRVGQAVLLFSKRFIRRFCSEESCRLMRRDVLLRCLAVALVPMAGFLALPKIRALHRRTSWDLWVSTVGFAWVLSDLGCIPRCQSGKVENSARSHLLQRDPKVVSTSVELLQNSPMNFQEPGLFEALLAARIVESLLFTRWDRQGKWPDVLISREQVHGFRWHQHVGPTVERPRFNTIRLASLFVGPLVQCPVHATWRIQSNPPFQHLLSTGHRYNFIMSCFQHPGGGNGQKSHSCVANQPGFFSRSSSWEHAQGLFWKIRGSSFLGCARRCS